MKLSSGKPKTDDSNPPANVSKTKTGTKMFAFTSSSQTPSMGFQAKTLLKVVLFVEKYTLLGGVRYSEDKHLPNGRNWLQTTKIVFHA